MSERRFIALSLDNEPAWFGLAKGVGHIILSTVVTAGGDHIGGNVTAPIPCSETKTLEGSRLVEKFQGDAKCKRCTAWLESTGGQNDLQEAQNVAFAESEGVAYVSQPTLMETGPGAVPVAVVPAIVEESETASVKRIKANAAKVADKASTETHTAKCAVKGVHKVKAVEGTDTDGVTGTCPTCRTNTKLTDKGFIGGHVINNAPVPASVELSQKSVPSVGSGHYPGAVSDAAKRREAEAVQERAGKRERPSGERSAAPSGRAAGQRGEARMDGVAMLPRGATGTAGVRFDPEVIGKPETGKRSKSWKRNAQRAHARKLRNQKDASKRSNNKGGRN